MLDEPMLSHARKLKYVDRPEVREVFADALERVMVDNSVLRLEFTVNRFNEAQKTGHIAGTRCTACRLVLPNAALLQVLEKLTQLASALENEGIIRRAQPTRTQN